MKSQKEQTNSKERKEQQESFELKRCIAESDIDDDQASLQVCNDFQSFLVFIFHQLVAQESFTKIKTYTETLFCL